VAREVPENGPMKLDLHIQRLWGKLSSPLQNAEFDSRDPQESYPGLFDPKVRQLVMLGGKTLGLLLTQDGRVESVSGYAEIYAGTPLGEALKKDGELLTNESYREEVQLLFAPLPAIALDEGAKWKSSYAFSVFHRDFLLEPACVLRERTASSVRWSFEALAEGEKGAVPVAIPAGATDEEVSPAAGLLSGTKIRSASLQGQATVSLLDGLLELQTAKRVVGADVPNPVGTEPIPSVVTHRIEVRRIAADSKSVPVSR
jgi:hypothetical protein